AHLLQQLLQCTPRLRGGVIDVPVLESFAGISQDIDSVVLPCPGSRGMTPGREPEPAPRGGTPAQVLVELLVMCQDDELPVRESIGQKLGESSAVLDVEAVDDVVEHEKADLLVEALRHREEQGNGERVQMRFA